MLSQQCLGRRAGHRYGLSFDFAQEEADLPQEALLKSHEDYLEEIKTILDLVKGAKRSSRSVGEDDTLYFDEFVRFNLLEGCDLYLAVFNSLCTIPCVRNSFQLKTNFRKFAASQVDESTDEIAITQYQVLAPPVISRFKGILTFREAEDEAENNAISVNDIVRRNREKKMGSVGPFKGNQGKYAEFARDATKTSPTGKGKLMCSVDDSGEMSSSPKHPVMMELSPIRRKETGAVEEV